MNHERRQVSQAAAGRALGNSAAGDVLQQRAIPRFDQIGRQWLGSTPPHLSHQWARAFALIASNSLWEIAPLSSNCFAFSISVAAPVVATDWT